MSALGKIIVTEPEKLGPIETAIYTAHFYKYRYASQAADELAEKNAALDTLVMFLTNANTITEEAQAELVTNLRRAGRVDLADAVALGGFASALKGE